DGSLAVYEHKGFWQCMDTYRDWQSLEAQWQKDEAPWKVWDQATRAGSLGETPVGKREDGNSAASRSIILPSRTTQASVKTSPKRVSFTNANENAEFGSSFRGKSVFVTGHTGFKGSWLSIWLERVGAKVSGYSLGAPTSPSNFMASGVRELLDQHFE